MFGLNWNCGTSYPAGPGCLRQQLVVWSFGRGPSSSSPLGLPAPPPQVQRHRWPSVEATVWGPQVDNRSGSVALVINISMDNSMLNTQSIHKGGVHNHTTSGSSCSRACNTAKSLRILLMLQLFCCKGIDLHTQQQDVAAGYCTHRGYMSCLRHSSFFYRDIKLLR